MNLARPWRHPNAQISSRLPERGRSHTLICFRALAFCQVMRAPECALQHRQSRKPPTARKLFGAIIRTAGK